MPIAIPGLLLAAYLPGALLYRVPLADRRKRAALPAEERVFWAVLISLALSTFSVLALAALGRYSLTNLLGVNGTVSAIVALVYRRRLAYDSPAPRPGWSALAPVLLVAVGLFLYFPGAEYVIGGKDPGIYVNQGIQIAQRGTLSVHDATIAAVPDSLTRLFLGETSIEMQEGFYQGLRFMGFFVQDRANGTVVGQFPQGFPAWMAVGYGLNGLSGARQVPGAWAIVALVAVYLLFARLLGALTAAAGALLLAVNVAEVWFARYPNSEMVQQALLAAGLLALARAYRDGDRFFDVVAAAAFGAMMFVRIDTVLALGVVGGGFVLLATDGTRPRFWFVASLAVPLAVAGPYYANTLRMYSRVPLIQLGGAPGIIGGVVALTAAITAVWYGWSKKPAMFEAFRRWLPRLLAAGVFGLAVYAYFLREPAGRLAEHDAYALRSLGWYVGGLGVGLAVVGLCRVLLRDFWKDPVTLTTLTGLAVFFLYKVRIVPDHFWQARRYLPVILPLACVMAAAAAFWPPASSLSGGKPRDDARTTRVRLAVARAVQAVVVLGALGWGFVSATRPILGHVEYAGVIPSLEKLAGRFGDRDLVLVESRNASDAHVLAAPLAYIYAKSVLVLNTSRPSPALTAAFLEWAWRTYDHVYFVADGGTALASAALDARPLGIQRIEVPEYESLRNAYPTHVRTKKFSLSLFQLEPAPAGTTVTDVDVGGQDDVWVLRIFAKQAEGAVSYRWTRNVSYVSMVGIAPRNGRLTLWMSNGGRPAAAGEARVRIRLNDHDLGEVVVGAGFAPYEVEVPAAAAVPPAGQNGVSLLRLDSTVWSPLKALGVPDDRDLGVMLDRVRIE